MGKSKFQGFHLWPYYSLKFANLTRLCFQRLKKNYSCLKWYSDSVQSWSPSLALTVVAVDLQSTTFTPFCFQILSLPRPGQFIFGCARPAVQSVCRSLCLSLRFFPLVWLHQLKPFQFLLPTPLTCPYSTVPARCKDSRDILGATEAPDLNKCCPALLQASEARISRWHAGLAKMQPSCDQLEQGCPLSLPPGMSLSGGQEKCVIRSSKRGGGVLARERAQHSNQTHQ